MAKHHLDNKIREVLKERTIAPSKDAWQVVEEQLGSVPEKGKRGIWGYGIAAGFIGILITTVFLLSRQSEQVYPSEEVVKTVKESTVIPLEIEKMEPEEEQKGIAVVPEEKDALPLEMKDRPDLEWEASELVDTSSEPNTKYVADDLVPIEKLETKVAEVVAQVTMLEDSQGRVDDEVIDSLLREAQMQLLLEGTGEGPKKIDALALLSDVEQEVNRSLRDQLFEKLKDGYLKVRTAIAYRND